MEENEMLNFVKSLADADRLRIVGVLTRSPARMTDDFNLALEGDSTPPMAGPTDPLQPVPSTRADVDPQGAGPEPVGVQPEHAEHAEVDEQGVAVGARWREIRSYDDIALRRD